MNTTLKRKDEDLLKTEISTMSTLQLNEEVNRRLNGIMSGKIHGAELNKLKNEASIISRTILRRG